MLQNPPDSPPGALLLVDDEPAILDLLTRVFDVAGYRCFCALNGAEALELFRRHHAEIAVIFTDVHMPVLDGFSLVRAAREIVPGVKIVISSGSLGEAEMRIAADLQVGAFLPKPYTPSQLVSCVRSLWAPGQ